MADPMTYDELLAELTATRGIVQNLRRRITDLGYMQGHLVQMLGPKALQVWRGWQAKGLVRLSVTWGPDAANLSGEELAQIHLDVEEAMKTAVPIDNIDSHISHIEKINVREKFGV